MAFFFFDESIHPSAGFITVVWVAWREDPTDRINDVLQTAGLQPGVDEFKPGSSPSAWILTTLQTRNTFRRRCLARTKPSRASGTAFVS